MKSCLAVGLALTCGLVLAEDVNPLVPFDFKAGDPAAQVAAMKTLREKFGLKRFVFTAPGQRFPGK